MPRTEKETQSIEELREQYENLNRRAIRAQTNLERAESDLATLEKQAKAAYGTADIKKLKAKLDEMQRENEKKRTEYQKLLAGIEKKLDKVEAEQGPEDA